MITLIQLEYIVAVDTYRHFVTASQKCFVTQPTLSMQIRKLEKDLGVTIFDRSKQPIIPTEIGKDIIEQARITLSESKKIEELIANHKNTISGELTIGIIPSLAPYLLPLFIGKFTKKYPDVQVKILELFSIEIIDQLKKDQIDVGILVTPLNEKSIMEQPLFYEEMLLYTNKNHTLATQQFVQTNELVNPDLWLLSNEHCFRSQIINLCGFQTKLKEDYHFEYESGSLETIKKLVEIEGGFTLLPELAIDKKMPETQTITRHFHSTTPLREVSMAYARGFAKMRLLKLLSEEIKNNVPKSMLNKERGYIVEWR